ncbi:MAG: TIGR02444 family protein [Pseudomonadota bacterium]
MSSINPFWEFSTALYEQPGVAETCIEAQDRWGADVNLLLFFAWQSQGGIPMQLDAIASLDAEISAWRRQVVTPIRELRRKLKAFPGADASRALIQQAELAAERAQQDLMLTHAGSETRVGGGQGLRAYLDLYTEFLRLPGEAFDDVHSVFESGLEKLASVQG